MYLIKLCVRRYLEAEVQFCRLSTLSLLCRQTVWKTVVNNEDFGTLAGISRFIESRHMDKNSTHTFFLVPTNKSIIRAVQKIPPSIGYTWNNTPNSGTLFIIFCGANVVYELRLKRKHDVILVFFPFFCLWRHTRPGRGTTSYSALSRVSAETGKYLI